MVNILSVRTINIIDLQNIQWSNGFIWQKSSIVKNSETTIESP